MKPTVFLEIKSQYKENPIAQALEKVTFGSAEFVKNLVEGEKEADIAVTNSTSSALRMIKETENTSIIVVYLTRQEMDEAKALAARFGQRVSAVSFVGSKEDGPSIVIFLLQAIAQITKEA